jgi:hypothetical protein
MVCTTSGQLQVDENKEVICPVARELHDSMETEACPNVTENPGKTESTESMPQKAERWTSGWCRQKAEYCEGLVLGREAYPCG